MCAAERGTTKTFACPYHGWTYDLSGALLGVPYPGGYDASFDKSTRGLAHAPRVASYRGFVFASLSAGGITLEQHLGKAVKLIDRSCDLSPDGEVELTAGWVKHRCAANWKMLPENDSDGYHLGFVHRALFKTVRSQYQTVVGDERTIKAVVRDWGGGHIEIDWSPGYQGPFEWFGGAPPALVADYVARMERRHGTARAQQLLFEGPAHALIFPNLFLGETNVAIVQPLSVDECVQHLSHIYDNRGRLETRVKMLQSGYRYSQEPASLMRRLIANVEITQAENGELVAESNFVLGELSVQAKHEMHSWIGRTTHRLRRVADELKMCAKKVVLVNAAEPLPNLTFLI